MIIERDVGIPSDDGLVLRADIFRPDGGEPSPVIMTHGPYGKGVEYKSGPYARQWAWLLETHPNILPDSTKSYMTWETVDPELWTTWGYVCIRIDSRGAGRTPGFLDVYSPRETKDFYEAIEWAARQPWSTGKVGLLGISYYAISQWLVASLQPPHLAAIVPWEGAGDFYRDICRHGGIASTAFIGKWYGRQVLSNQHGNSKGQLDPWLKELATGPEQLSEGELAANYADLERDILSHPLDSEYYRGRSANWSKITIPFLSAANVAGFGLHARGNYEAFTQAASTKKWLEIHPGRHEEWFYLDEKIEMQRRFLDHFLKGIDNGWDQESPVLLHLRRPFSTKFELRKETEWPLRSTRWTNIYFEVSEKALSWQFPVQQSSIAFEALGEPVMFMSAPLTQETEITGPLAAKLFISSSTIDADFFLTLQAFSPDGREVEFPGTIDPHTPLAQGWLRASHRKLDTKLSLPYRPYHTHDEIQPLTPGQIYELDIEIWPTHIILPAGFQISLQIGGKDFERPLPPNAPVAEWESRGSGPWLHNNPEDRPAEVYGGTTTIYTGGATTSTLLLPVIEKH
ncbi:uncharacterized protein TRUGW13939_01045 [Talaromyces rugulosus]|uniref:Xaa-Pro dipeptidyl-peptidase C-terminal domain-containing protein n=1 Tax=Talaromyces rugulosus TaxID=121627 RepID=A0A7H8QKD8_TALRU|nr:uncharacterized protein TRUGW13939_01045 [Talaromyces rugulosus]QKX53965.1 hypothetical protein TRUGW13939_01045 [Talaromyces rugulosus]